MAAPKSSRSGLPVKTVAENRKARHEYAFDDTFEAGIQLHGTEVKSLRFGKGNIAESYAEIRNGEAWLVNSNIPEFSHGNRHNHTPTRPRKLLLRKREIDRLGGAIQRKGMTLVPIKLYFDANGRVKLELALAKGKQLHDKRQAAKDADWKRQKQRLMKDMS